MKICDVLPALEKMGACFVACGWLDGFGHDAAPQAAWDACERGDWMLWLLGRLAWRAGDPFGATAHRRLIGCTVEIVLSLAQPFWRKTDREVLNGCMDVLARYASGDEVSRGGLRKVRNAVHAASYAASYAAYTTSYADAYAAASHAADAAYAAAAPHAAVAADAAYAAYAADAASRAESLRASAEIVRVWYPVAPEVTA